MVTRLKAAILGATGMIGQKFAQLLDGHPWFEVTCIAASDRSVGKKYGIASRWILAEPIPDGVSDLEVVSAEPKEVGDVEVVFSALPADAAGKTEENFARDGKLVLSNASAHRMDTDVPILNPEVNAEHVHLIEEQRRRRKWDGAIVTNPNCTSAVLTLSLKPVHDRFGLDKVIMTSLQALSGAGYPGVSSLDILDNVIPYIAEEEDKVQEESRKMLGSIEHAASFKISASCNRVATSDGHFETVFLKTEKHGEPEDISEAMTSFRGEPQRLGLPTAPPHPVIVRPEEDRPQPRIDRMAGKGMSVVVGRLRKDSAIEGVKYVVLGHNLIRGAAGCSILNAELLKAKGYV